MGGVKRKNRESTSGLEPLTHSSPARLLTTAGSLGYAAVHRHLGELQTDDPVVGLPDEPFQCIHGAELYPLVASAAQGSSGALLVGDPPARAAEHSDLQQFLEGRRLKPPLKRAELLQFGFHDLRQTCATILLMAGKHPKYVQELLGHTSIFIALDTYSHVIEGMDGGLTEAMDDAL